MLQEFFLVASLSFYPNWMLAGYSQDRCSMQGCMAEVQAQKVNLLEIKKDKKESTSVFYQEDLYYLNYELRTKVRNFVQGHPKVTKFYVTGFTDGCGSHAYNKELSRKRADAVARYILSMRSNAVVQLKWEGEATGKHTVRARRVDVSVSKKVRETITPTKIIADFYLIDGSGSMDGAKWQNWIYAIKYWRPSHARVFVSTTGYNSRSQDLVDIKPYGGTEIWFSYWTILDKMKAGQKLIIISDFNSEIPLSPSENARLTKKARSKGVIVKFVRP